MLNVSTFFQHIFTKHTVHLIMTIMVISIIYCVKQVTMATYACTMDGASAGIGLTSVP